MYGLRESLDDLRWEHGVERDRSDEGADERVDRRLIRDHRGQHFLKRLWKGLEVYKIDGVVEQRLEEFDLTLVIAREGEILGLLSGEGRSEFFCEEMSLCEGVRDALSRDRIAMQRL